MTREERERGLQQAERAIDGAIREYFTPLPGWVMGKTVIAVASGLLMTIHDDNRSEEAANLVIDLLKNLGNQRPALLKAVYERMATILPGEKVAQA